MGHAQGPNVPHGTLSDYIWGLIWSVILTAIAFGVVMTGSFDKITTIVILLVSAVTQIFVQLFYFLHMKRTPDQSWNIITGLFTIVQVLILFVGTLWVMYHLYINMQIGY